LPRNPTETIRFQRSRFIARLPKGYLYSPAHLWLAEETPGVWRIGLTSFATRMLGEIVEMDFEVTPGSPVKTGEVVGWLEGFKATTDLFCVADGQFQSGNPSVLNSAEEICSDPYGEGWLYAVEGTPDPQSLPVEDYLELLGETIDQMEEKPWQTPEMGS